MNLMLMTRYHLVWIILNHYHRKKWRTSSTPHQVKAVILTPYNTTLLKEILPSVINIFTEIINKLLISGIFLESLKVGLVKPLLKKANLDLIEKNYRPVPNIEFIGKSIEREATVQLTRHITNENLIEWHQQHYLKWKQSNNNSYWKSRNCLSCPTWP